MTFIAATLSFLDRVLVVFNCLRQGFYESFGVAMRHNDLHALLTLAITVVN